MRTARIVALLLVAASATIVFGVRRADATVRDSLSQRRAAMHPWHGAYYHVHYGQPLALVVPPTAGNQTNYGWGVGSYRVTPIHHQFGRAYAYPSPSPGFSPPPVWPSDTTQFGVYYIRGPW